MHRLQQSPSDDLVIGMTTTKSLVVWRFNPWAAHRVLHGHTDWCEALVCLQRPGTDGRPGSQVFSGSADGAIIRWQPSGSLSTDLFSIIEEVRGPGGTPASGDRPISLIPGALGGGREAVSPPLLSLGFVG